MGRKLEKLLALFSCVLLVEVILRCVSRGGMLALLAAGIWPVLTARGRIRRYAIVGVVLAAAAAYSVTGEHDREKVIGRFVTIFAPEEERDASAESRLLFWERALKMLGDHPLGSGAEAAFNSRLGFSYIRDISNVPRAIHNGYLDIATSWGVQGLALYLGAFLLAWLQVHRGVAAARAQHNDAAAFLGCCIQAALVLKQAKALG